jgi:hypothetical protein
MTIHARSEHLAAIAIDFELTPAEHAEMTEHLATCQACRALAVAYRTDAAGMREIAFAQPPAQIRLAVIAATARPVQRTIQPWKLLVAAALLLGALVGVAAAIGAWNSRPTLLVTVPVATPSAGPETGPTPTTGSSPIVPLVALEVGCGGTGIQIPTPVVRASADGVHIHVVNTSGAPLDFGIENASGLAIAGDEVPGASGAYVYTIGTGTYGFTCGQARTTFAVVDPDGLYAPLDLSCDSQTKGTTDYAAGATGPHGSPVDIAGRELRGLLPTDVVESAGYPQASGPHFVRVVRDGRVIAVLGFEDDGHGGWLSGGLQTCAGSGISTASPNP